MYRLPSTNFSEAAYANTFWSATIPHDTPYKEIFDPMYWANIARKLTIADLIKVVADDGSYSAILFVNDCSEQWAKVSEFVPQKLFSENTETPVSVDNEYFVKWRGPNGGKWCVLRKPNVVLFSDCQSKEDAEAWLREHMKTIR